MSDHKQQNSTPERTWLDNLARWKPAPQVILWAVIMLIGAFIASSLGPVWQPESVSPRVQPSSESTEIRTANNPTPVGTYEIQLEQHMVDVPIATQHSGFTPKVEIFRPVGAQAPAPMMFFMHGTGTDRHTGFRREAERIASTGVITVVADKDVTHYTSSQRDYDYLATYASQIFDWALLNLPGIDHTRSGVYAVSESAMFAPKTVSENPNVRYLVLVSPPVLTIREDGSYAAESYLQHVGVPERFRLAVRKLLGHDFGVGNFEYFDFDPDPYFANIRVPIMALYGTGDYSIPLEQGVNHLLNLLPKNPQPHLTVRYYADADHGLKYHRKILSTFAMQDVSDWVGGLPQTAAQLLDIAGAQPDQGFNVPQIHPAKPSLAFHAHLYVWSAFAVVFTNIWAYLKKYSTRGHLSVSASVIMLTWLIVFAYILGIAYAAVNYIRAPVMAHIGLWITTAAAAASAWYYARSLLSYGANWKKAGGVAKITCFISLISQAVLLGALAYWNLFPFIL